MRWFVRTLLPGFALLLAVGVSSIARADGGEAGLVIQHGDGTPKRTAPFHGDGIRGDEPLVALACQSSIQRFVCALEATRGRLSPASSFESCTCKCQGSNCVYWAFFTQSYGRQ